MKRFFVTLLIICLSAALCSCGINSQSMGSDSEESQVFGDGIIKTVDNGPVQIVLSAAGDCTLGRELHAGYPGSFDETFDKYGPGVFFGNVSQFFNDDLTIINYEGTITESSDMREKQYRFKGRKEYTQVLNEGSVEVVNIANNHSFDYLDQGYIDTLNALGEAGVAAAGNDFVAIREVKGVKVGFYGIDLTDNEYRTFDDEMRGRSQYDIWERIMSLKLKGCKYIVGCFHFGLEREKHHSASQEEYAHYAVDMGTNLVIGHHAHVLQDTEIYNGAQIIYSLGNFCFGGNTNPEDKDTCVFQEIITMNPATGEIQDRNRTFYPYRMSTSKGRNDYQPIPVEGEDADRVYKKLKLI